MAAKYSLLIGGFLINLNQPPNPTDDDLEVTLKVAPKGKQAIPATSPQLKHAIRCVLTFLVDFHREGLVHRDLRWPNILEAKKWELFCYRL